MFPFFSDWHPCADLFLLLLVSFDSHVLCFFARPIVAALERKMSVRVQREELIQKGILLPDTPTNNSPASTAANGSATSHHPAALASIPGERILIFFLLSGPFSLQPCRTLSIRLSG